MTLDDEIEYIQTKKLLHQLLDAIDNDILLAEPIGYHIHQTLDNMVENDVFGSEGQLDPRGDNR